MIAHRVDAQRNNFGIALGEFGLELGYPAVKGENLEAFLRFETLLVQLFVNLAFEAYAPSGDPGEFCARFGIYHKV